MKSGLRGINIYVRHLLHHKKAVEDQISQRLFCKLLLNYLLKLNPYAIRKAT